MAAFKQDFTIQQSADCSTLTFADNSNMVENDEGYDFSTFTTKNIAIYDSTNTLVGSVIPIIDATPVTTTIASDMYLSIVYTLQIGTDTPLTKTYDVVLSCNIDLAYGAAIISNILYENGPGSTPKEDDSTLFSILKTVTAAKIFASRNNGTLAQDMLDLANSYIDTTNNCLN